MDPLTSGDLSRTPAWSFDEFRVRRVQYAKLEKTTRLLACLVKVTSGTKRGLLLDKCLVFFFLGGALDYSLRMHVTRCC